MLWIVLVGLALGAAAGLVYSWVVSPVRYSDTAPYSLAPAYKDTYRLLVAASYGASGDLERARARLALLADPDPVRALAAQAQQAVAAGGLSAEARQLALLAAALGQHPAPQAIILEPPLRPRATPPPARPRGPDPTHKPIP